MRTWRERYAPQIARTIARIADPSKPIDADARRAIRKELRAQWLMHGEIDSSYEYAQWKQESRFQMGLAPPPRDRGRPPNVKPTYSFPDPRQAELFGKQVSPELRLIESIMKAGAKKRSAGNIAANAPPGLVSYAQVVRILHLAGQNKTPDQILRYLQDDERQRAMLDSAKGSPPDGRFHKLPEVQKENASDIQARKRRDRRQVSEPGVPAR